MAIGRAPADAAGHLCSKPTTYCTVPPHRRLGVGGGGPSCLLIAGVRNHFNHITAPRSGIQYDPAACAQRRQCGAAMVQLAA
jgi:hypothetical protein